MKEEKNYFNVFLKPALFVGALLLLAGVFAYNKMQTNLFPEVLFPRISIIADAGQQPTDRMLITVTKPLESAVKKVKGVTVVKTATSRGSCTIDVYFDWGLDIYSLKSQVESRINEIKGFLPAGVSISTESMNQSLFPVLGYTLESDNHNAIALRDQANLVLRPAFSQVVGISNVIVRGGKAKEYVVIPDPIKMSALAITPNAIITAFNNNNFVLSNGYVADYKRLYLNLTDTRVNDVEELQDVVIKSDTNRIVKLKDIAHVEIQEKQEFVKVNANGHEAVLIDLVKQPGINLLTFAKDAEAKAAELRTMLPKGYILKPYYNQSVFVGDSVHSVVKTIYEGLILAIIVMIIFLRSWRASLVVIFTIPVTLCFTLLILYLMGITINVMSLGAIAASVGLIIDDAIVIIEQIYREHEEFPDENKFIVVKKSIHNLFPAMVASSLSTIVIFVPFRMMSGLAGSFFYELSLTMQVTLVCSFLVTWLLLPVLHLVIGYRPSKHSKEHPASETDTKVAWLARLSQKPLVSLFVTVLLGVMAWLALSNLETGFLPDLDEGTIVLDYFSPPGTSLEETDQLCQQMEKIIMANPNVEAYSRRTGMRMAFRAVPANFGDYLIQLKTDRKQTTPDVIADLRQNLQKEVPVLEIGFGQRISDLLGDLMSTPSPIEIKIFGDDYNTLKQLTLQAEKILDKIPGITDINNGLVTEGPSLVFKPDQQKLNRYNISLIDFQSQLNTYVGGVPLGMNANTPEPSAAQAAMSGGIQIGQMQDGEQMRRILFRFADFSDNDVERIKRQLIFLPDGSTRPVSFFTDVTVASGDIERRREDLKPCIVLTARLEKRDLGSAIKDIQNNFKSQLPLPQGYSVAYGGAYSEQQQSFRELLFILGLAILLVLAVLIFRFREWLISLVVLFVSIMGISGCILGLYITNIPLNVSSYTGIIMIVGIIAENAIFTVSQFKTNFLETGDVDGSINHAIALRIRPKLMTALGAILALTPLALGIGLGAQMQQPLAVAVIGGFVVGLPMLLIVLPSLMRLVYRKEKLVATKQG